MTKSKKIKIIILSFALMFVCLLSTLLSAGAGVSVAYASVSTDGNTYTNVLDDLNKDGNFNADDYPINMTDYTLSVIQVAESNDKELFVYVYQPCSPNEDLQATTINISTGIGENLSYNNYKLSLLNSAGVFYKYKVKNFSVLNDTTRYYDISSIFRKWNADYDAPSGNDNTITEVSFAVATRFTARTTQDGKVEYANNGVDVVYITQKWCGFVRYSGGFELLGWADACDSWFVAFNTDRRIDKLLEADVYYTQQMWFHGLMGYPTYQYMDVVGQPEDKIAYLEYTQKGEFQGSGWWASYYSWDRITTTEQFIAQENRENMYELGVINVKQEVKLTDETLNNLRGTQWVLRFAETAYEEDGTTESHLITQQIIGNVSILRLKFETDGVVYNLGVVDNKQSADLIPDNEEKWSVELADWFKVFLAILLLILLLIVLAPFLPVIFNVIWWVIKAILKFVWWVISLPFKIFKRKDKEKRKN